MGHRFYSKARNERRLFQWKVGILAILLISITFFISWWTGFYVFGILSFSIILSLLASFFDTPALKKSGDLVYYSDLFLAEKPKKGSITIHGGTLFDYVFVIDRKWNGKQRTDFIIQQYLEGLLNLIETKQSQYTRSLKIKGTSYMLNERTAMKMGFNIVQTDFLRKLILIYNYFNVMLTYSISKRKLSFPKVGNTISIETSFDELIKRKDFISGLNEKLKNKQKVF